MAVTALSILKRTFYRLNINNVFPVLPVLADRGLCIHVLLINHYDCIDVVLK